MKKIGFFFSLTAVLFLCTACFLFPSEDEVQITISPDGGNFEVFPDADIFIPQGAVTEEVDITFRKLLGDELDAMKREDVQLLTVFEALPEGQVFSEPITITLSGLNLDPGTIPLIRQIDPEQGSRLIETSVNYDPDNDTLEFNISHFTFYGVEAGKMMSEKECGDIPCRCQNISIEQSDSDEMCSEDDCQVLESDLDVKFNDCPGKPSETSYLKEISPGCTPRMEVNPTVYKVEPEGTTEITATTRISCIPIPEQTVDFVIRELGWVDPTLQITDQEGNAVTTFTAGEEEGLAVVNVYATGSYYAFEVRANGESFTGPMKTYELSESTEIEIGPLSGVLEGSFEGCNEIVCLEGYQMRLDFSITEIDWESGIWFGEGVLTQSGNLESNFEYGTVANLYMANDVELSIQGNAYSDSGELDLEILTLILLEHFLWDFENPGGSSEIYIDDFFGIGFGVGVDSEGLPVPLRFTIDGPSPQGGPAIIELFAGNQPIPGTYTLTLE